MKLARHDNTICHICNKAILLNEEIFPFLKVFDYDSTLTNYKLIFSKKIFSWCHINCVCKILKCKDKKCLVKPLCPFYAKNQYCGYGSSCFYRHVNVDDSILQTTLKINNKEKNDIIKQAIINSNNKKGKKKRKKRNQNFATKFKNWLVEKYGMDNLIESNILDIAGGKGELSFEMLYLVGVQSSTVIDPRILNVVEMYKKLRSGKYIANTLYHKYISTDRLSKLISLQQRQRNTRSDNINLSQSDLLKDMTLNRILHLKMFFNEKTIDWYDKMADININNTSFNNNNNNNDHDNDKIRNCKVLFGEFLTATENTILVGETGKIQEYKKRVSKDEMVFNNKLLKDMNVTKKTASSSKLIDKIIDGFNAFNIMKKCNLILGLHCDGAAEHIIDFALKYNIKFAIIPCCTCSKDFPNRKLNGKLVKSYDDLLEYLRNKDKRINMGVIKSFAEGSKNKVLYMF